MLVLTRKVGQTLVLGDGIEVKLLRIKGKSRITLGIQGRGPVPVRRLECDGAAAPQEEPPAS